MRRACWVLASLLAACSEPAPPPKALPPIQAYFQDYVVSERAPGFRLQNQIEQTRADPKRFYWRATYDREGRVVTLETFAYPACLQSQLNLSYDGKPAGKEQMPVKRQRQPASDCKPAKTF
jgi:hypothetical protein